MELAEVDSKSCNLVICNHAPGGPCVFSQGLISTAVHAPPSRLLQYFQHPSSACRELKIHPSRNVLVKTGSFFFSPPLLPPADILKA